MPDALTDFLLARIAEEEGKYSPTWAGRPRYLEWCRAKRQLVQALDRRRIGDIPDPFAVDMMRREAALWAAHPDYRPEWRPDA